MRVGGMRHHARHRREAQLLGDACPGHDECRRTVRDRGGVGRRDRAVLDEGWFERRDLLGLRLSRLLVDGDGLHALPGLHLDAHYLALERARPDRLLRSEEHTSELTSLMRISYA